LKDAIGESFVKTIIQPKIKLILWELEQPYISMSKVQAERRKTNIQTENLIREKESELKQLANEIYDLKKTLCISPTPVSPIPSSSEFLVTPVSPIPSSSEFLVTPGLVPTPVSSVPNEMTKNPYINMFCPSYVPVPGFSISDLLVKTDKYGPHYKDQLMSWYTHLDRVMRTRPSLPSDQNEWRIPYLLHELSEEEYRSKLYSQYKENEQHREQVEQHKAYISLSYYLMSQLSEYLESVFINEARIQTLFETEEEMRSVLL